MSVYSFQLTIMVFRSKIHWKSVLPCFQNKVCQKCETNFSAQIQIENFSIKKCHQLNSSSFLVSPIFFSQTGNHQSVECSLISLFVQYYYSNLRITVIYMTHMLWLITDESSLYSIYILIIVMNMYLGLLQYTIFFIKIVCLFSMTNEDRMIHFNDS